VARMANPILERELRDLADGNARDSRDLKWGVTPAQARVLADRLKAGERAIATNLPDYLSKAVLHELSHAVGLDHHDPDPRLGTPSCLMHYPQFGALARRLLEGFPAQTLCGDDTCRPRLRLLPP